MNRYVIWSWRHRMWWGADHEGYTSDLAAAGRYDRDEAADIMLNGLPGGSLAIDVNIANHFDHRAPSEVEEMLDRWRRA